MRLAVVDPALGYSQGHHLASIVLLSEGMQADELILVGSYNSSQDTISTLDRLGLSLNSVFTQPFYQLSDDTGNNESTNYIRLLAAEYVEALLNTKADKYLFHTLSWMHARALAVALQYLYRQGASLKHCIIFTMFNPGLDHRLKTLDLKVESRFSGAFTTLSGIPGVQIFASCREYSIKYQRLLRRSEPLDLHPIFFENIRVEVNQDDKGEDLEILYFGDPKIEKGIDKLPELIRRKLAHSTGNFLVHISSNFDPSLEPVIDDVRALSANERVELIEGFLEEKQVNNLFERASKICLNYDATAYSQKTSGLVWIAHFFGLHITTPQETWLAREVEYLKDSEYASSLSTPFVTWLRSLKNSSLQKTVG
mgnify:FL=1